MRKSALTYAMNIASILIAMLIVYLAVRIILGLTNPQSLWEASPIADNVTTAQVNHNASYDFSSDPFSLTAAALPLPNDLGETAPETTLQLTLTGLITGPDGEVNLRTPDGREDRYTSGDEIMSNVTLEAINSKFIVLNVNGEIQRLTFDDSESLIASANKVKPQNPVAQNQVLGAANGQTNLSALETLLSAVNINPEFKGDKMVGMRISKKTSDVSLQSYGLRDGDIVTQIGDTKLNSPSVNPIALMRSLEGKRSVNVTVIRDGREQKIQLGQ